ncbi:MAG: ABC transporter substrate-binding protein [Chloroflexota bacterium]|nr:ABC transporter substrate-binding protein [Chloroflexota bacterium]
MSKKIVRWIAGIATAALLVTPALAQDNMPMMESLMGTDVRETCADPAALPEMVTIGAVLTLSGGASVYGVVQQQGIQLAVDEINNSGYLGADTLLNVIFEDSTSVNEQAIAAMTKLVEEDQVVAVIGPTLSREAFSADPIAQDAGVTVLGVSNTAAGITDMGDFVFRNSLPEASVIPGTVVGAVAGLGIESAAIIYANDDDFTVSGADVFRTALEANGVTIVSEETYATGDADFNAQLTNMIAQNPDAIAISALTVEAVQIITQARAQGYEGTLMGGNGLNSPAVLEQTGVDSEGVIVGAAWNVASPNELSVAFTAAFENAHEAKPDQFAAQAYTGAWMIASAIRCADSADRTAVRDALLGLSDFATPLGAFNFDADRNPVHDPVVQVNVDGAFSVLGAE